MASGAPLFAGLIAGIIGGIVVGSISGSPLGVSGPAAGLTVIVLHAIADLGYGPFLLAVLLSGLLQILLGLGRAGALSYFFPLSVIRGMLVGIGTIIVLKQIPHAFGYDADPEGDDQFLQPDGETTFSELVRMLDHVEWRALAVSLTGLTILLVWDNVLAKRAKIFRLLQGPLVAVIFGISYQLLTQLFAPHLSLGQNNLVSVPVPESFTEFLGLFQTPEWSSIGNSAVWVAAATIAVVGSLETLLCLDATDKIDPQRRVTPANRELIAQGIGNTVSGAIGGLPITQVIVRSSANIQSGAVSKLSTILHGTFLLLAVLCIPQVLNYVPLPVLASILLVVGYKLAKPAVFLSVYRQGLTQFIPFIVTVVSIVLTDLLTGICYGMLIAVIVILRRNYLNSHRVVTEDKNASGKPVMRLLLSEEATFLNKGAILKAIANFPDGSHVIIDMSHCASVDHDVLEVIEDFERSADDRRISIEKIPHLTAETAGSC